MTDKSLDLPEDMQDECQECGSLLDTDGTCWHCQYERQNQTFNDTNYRLERKIETLRQEVSDLEYHRNREQDRADAAERKVHDLERKVNELEYNHRDSWR